MCRAFQEAARQWLHSEIERKFGGQNSKSKMAEDIAVNYVENVLGLITELSEFAIGRSRSLLLNSFIELTALVSNDKDTSILQRLKRG